MAQSSSSIGVQSTGATNVATNTFVDSVSGQTKHMQANNLYDTTGADAVGTGASGVSPATGGVGILGWLSTIAKAITGTLTVAGTISNFPAAQGNGQNSSGTGQFIPIADNSVPINCAANTTQTLVTGVAGKIIYVTGFDFVSNTGGTAQFVYGAGNTALSGPYPDVAQSGAARGGGVGLVLKVPAGQDLKMLTASGGTAYGSLSYTQF